MVSPGAVVSGTMRTSQLVPDAAVLTNVGSTVAAPSVTMTSSGVRPVNWALGYVANDTVMMNGPSVWVGGASMTGATHTGFLYRTTRDANPAWGTVGFDGSNHGVTSMKME